MPCRLGNNSKALQHRLNKIAKSGDKAAKAELAVLEKVLACLENGEGARKAQLTKDELPLLKELNLLTLKPILYICNVAEDEAATATENPLVQKVTEFAAAEGSQVVAVSAKNRIGNRRTSRWWSGYVPGRARLPEAGLTKLIHASYALLGLINFFTAGADEVRAWTIVKGTRAQKAAGKIHTDIERGFIRAEIVSYDDLIACGSELAAKEKGLVRLEGKDYPMQDGDVTYFRFNV